MATHESITDFFKAAVTITPAKTDLQISRIAKDLFRDAIVLAGESHYKKSDKLLGKA